MSNVVTINDVLSQKQRFGADGFVVAPKYFEIADQVENFEVRDDDTWVTGFQKTGTSWLQELVWCIGNNLDFENTTPQNQKCPELEMCGYYQSKRSHRALWDSINFLNEIPEKRFIKSHLPWQLLPKQIRTAERKPKIIYTYRDPKDTTISFYFHLASIGYTKLSIEEFCEEMLHDKELYCPFWKHVDGFLAQEHLPNVLITTYEEMQRDLSGVIRKVAAFLEKALTESQIDHLNNHLKFSSMSKNKTFNERHYGGGSFKFLRSGQVGDHKNYMTPELIQRFDDWTKTSREQL